MPPKEEPKFNCHDGVPDHEAWVEWEEQLLTHGGKADEQGSSIADCILDVHRGSAGNPHVGTPAQLAKSQALERALKKEAFSYMLLHMGCADQRKAVFTQFFNRGGTPDVRGAFLYLESALDVPQATVDEEKHELDWINFSIVEDVGYQESTVKDSVLPTSGVQAVPAINRLGPCAVGSCEFSGLDVWTGARAPSWGH